MLGGAAGSLWCLCSAASLSFGKEIPHPFQLIPGAFSEGPKPREIYSGETDFPSWVKPQAFPPHLWVFFIPRGCCFTWPMPGCGIILIPTSRNYSTSSPSSSTSSLSPTSKSCSTHISLDAKHHSHPQKQMERCPLSHVPGTARPPHPFFA